MGTNTYIHKVCKLIKSLFLAILFIPLFAFSASASVIFVDASATGANNGKSWSDAYTNLQSALGAAVARNQIWVAAGTYKPTTCASPTSCTAAERSVSFNIPQNLSLYGGFAGTETDLDQRNLELNQTILSGDLLGNDITDRTSVNYVSSHLDNSFHVVTANAVSFLMDGFTIYGGYNETPGSPSIAVHGAGLIYSNGIAPNTITLNNMIFNDNFIHGFASGNSFTGSGGAVYIINPSPTATNILTLNINNSSFTNNHAQFIGGAMNIVNANTYITNTIFDHNSLDVGGNNTGSAIRFDGNVAGIVANVDHSSFTNNNLIGSGPGAIVNEGVTLSLTYTNFINNHGEQRGGALFSDSRFFPSVTNISHCQFLNNFSSVAGAIATIGVGTTGSLTIDHSEFINNRSTLATQAFGIEGFGGAIFNVGTPSVMITNTLFKGNSAIMGGGAISTARSNLAVANAHFIPNTVLKNDSFINNSSSTNNGGVIYDNASLNLTISRSLFFGNSASGGNGGAIILNGVGVLTSQTTPVNRVINISKNLFLANSATNGGVGVLIHNTGIVSNINYDLETITLYFDANISAHNTASTLGGALYQNGGAMSVTNSLLVADSAASGKEIYIQLPATTNGQTTAVNIINALISSNFALPGSNIFVNP